MKVKVSKFLSYLLRHHPERYNLILDNFGYANLKVVLNILNNRFKNTEIDKGYIEDLIQTSSKKRFEIFEDKIRALYGHSIKEKIHMKISENLPKILYHGTTEKAYKSIRKEGLKRKNRQYVHLTEDKETAYKVGKRRTNSPIILEINVESASNHSTDFYKSGNMYLADFISAKFINILEKDE
ncbi:MAG: RNA 2'-phosphotransferase [Candidatus Lokiarchaeota archaeon]|nr:RNA 2'-phosphotransferase [Candidatus Lokiarchaeota archaeon]MBD3202396.1 RNA 2'-phosphotransferase [Candidatus Lokiarchaeota archaeon]